MAANQTVLVGVNATSYDDCVCPIQTAVSQCSSGYCYNNGICHEVHSTAVCECGDNLSGFRCQGTTRSFFGADSYAWFKTMPACTSLNISFSFATT